MMFIQYIVADCIEMYVYNGKQTTTNNQQPQHHQQQLQQMCSTFNLNSAFF